MMEKEALTHNIKDDLDARNRNWSKIDDLSMQVNTNTSELANKVDKVEGKDLSTNDYTDADKQKLANIQAEANKTVISNNLNETTLGRALDATQGKVLKDEINLVSGEVASLGDSFDSYKEEFDLHKEDYANYQNDINLKIATVERELNNYKSTMASVNVNQEAKQTASGYGIVSLPKNAASGQVSISVKGSTVTNIMGIDGDCENTAVFTRASATLALDSANKVFGNNSIIVTSTISAGGSFGLYKTYQIDPTKYYLVSMYGRVIDAANWYVSVLKGSTLVSIKNGSSNTNTTFVRKAIKLQPSDLVGETSIRPYFRGISNGTGTKLAVDGMQLNEISATDYALTEEQLMEKYPYVNNTKSTIGAGRLQSTDDKGNVIDELYYIAKDKDGNIIWLRSVPSANDEIRVSGGKAELVKRVSDEVVLNGSEDWTVGSGTLTETVSFKAPLSNMLDSGAISSSFAKYVTSGISSDDTELLMALNGYLYIRILKTKLGAVSVEGFKTWLQSNPIALTYQLAEPIITPIQVSGALLSNPSGTVYVEPVVADAGIYTDKLTVLHQDLPIDYIEKLSKVDFNTGVETELDSSKCVIAEDKLSFTHPDLVANDIVFFTYFYDKESTLGETTIEYYDSRHVLKDTVTGKFYKIVPTVADGVLTNQLVEV